MNWVRVSYGKCRSWPIAIRGRIGADLTARTEARRLGIPGKPQAAARRRHAADARYNAFVGNKVREVEDHEVYIEEMAATYKEMLRNHLADPNL